MVAKVLEDRRAPRRRGRMGTGVIDEDAPDLVARQLLARDRVGEGRDRASRRGGPRRRGRRLRVAAGSHDARATTRRSRRGTRARVARRGSATTRAIFSLFARQKFARER
eukprot:29892-Pelagococcus_subviridis.AAC.2